MTRFLSLPEDRRRTVFEQSATRLRLPEYALEKDFWVCQVLHALFQLPRWGEHLTFKGGTSLSKGWKLIERFSEDIDIVIDRNALGYPASLALSETMGSTRRKRLVNGIRAACREVVGTTIAELLREQMAINLPVTCKWDIIVDGDDPDGQTLLYRYPSLFVSENTYIAPAVKVEMGARSDTEPTEAISITPYIAETFPDLFDHAATNVRAVSPVRTFWEKALLLHEERLRPAGLRRGNRYLSRHYYDLWRLIHAGVGARATTDMALFQRIVRHRSVLFHYGWVDYEDLLRGIINVLPQEGTIAGWESDYNRMRGEMFFGVAPSFNEIIDTVRLFQDEFNRRA